MSPSLSLFLARRGRRLQIAADELEKIGVLRLLRQIVDLNRVGQRTGDRLVDEDRLAGLENGLYLFEMRPAVDAFEQDDVDFGQKRIDAVDDLDSMFLPERIGESLDPRMAGLDVRAASRKGSPRPWASRRIPAWPWDC